MASHFTDIRVSQAQRQKAIATTRLIHLWQSGGTYFPEGRF
jgi:hypothetical protein